MVDGKEVADVVVGAAGIALKLTEAAMELVAASRAGDAEAERQALLKANRIASDELARREANA